jgi:hypothetical protein
VSIGAIRWDAWFEEPEVPPLINHASFWGHQWFERLPFDAKLSDGKWLTASDKQSIVDQEIDYAVTRGIDYWAFVYGRFTANDYETGTYPDYADLDGYLRDNYRQGRILDMYLASSHCAKPRFALIVGAGAFNDYPQRLAAGGHRRLARRGLADSSSVTSARCSDARSSTRRSTVVPSLFMIRGVDWGHAGDDNPTLAGRSSTSSARVAVADGAKPAFSRRHGHPARRRDRGARLRLRRCQLLRLERRASATGRASRCPWSQADFDVDWVARTQLAEGLDVIPTVVPRLGLPARDSRSIPGRDPRGNWFEHAAPRSS